MRLFRAVVTAAIFLAVVPRLFASEPNPFVRTGAAFAASSGDSALRSTGRFADLSEVVLAQQDNSDSESDNDDRGKRSQSGKRDRSSGRDEKSDNEDGGKRSRSGGRDDDSDNEDGGSNSLDSFSVGIVFPTLPPLPGASGLGSMPVERVTVSNCLPAGRANIVATPDGRITLRSFASMPQDLRITIRQHSTPVLTSAPPGRQVSDLLFNVTAEGCNGQILARIPAEINVGVNYSDTDAAGLNEANFTLALLDQDTNQWLDVGTQANSPLTNSAGATIVDPGFFVLYERPS